jgi:hypothetical protein
MIHLRYMVIYYLCYIWESTIEMVTKPSIGFNIAARQAFQPEEYV